MHFWATGTRGSQNCVLAIKDSEDTMSGYTLTIYDPSNHTTTFIE